MVFHWSCNSIVLRSRQNRAIGTLTRTTQEFLRLSILKAPWIPVQLGSLWRFVSTNLYVFPTSFPYHVFICLYSDLYYTAFPKDKLSFQLLVYGIYVVETVQTVMITWDAFQNFAFGFADLQALDQINMLWLDCCILDGFGER